MILNVITDYLINILLPLGISFVFTWLIGLERQNIGKSAGISAHVLVGMSCCGLALLQTHITAENPSSDNQRLIAGAITGIGFLGQKGENPRIFNYRDESQLIYLIKNINYASVIYVFLLLFLKLYV